MEIVINRPITSKYKEVVEEIRDSMRLGSTKEDAVEKAFEKYWFKFESQEDMDILRSWFDGTFSKAA